MVKNKRLFHKTQRYIFNPVHVRLELSLFSVVHDFVFPLLDND